MESRHLALILSDQPCRCTVQLLGCCSLLLTLLSNLDCVVKS